MPHTTEPSRGKAVVTDRFGANRPEVWLSDMLGSQRGHVEKWQVCLAHPLRDAAYAIECGDTAFSAPFRRLPPRAIAIGQRRDTLKDTTLTQYLHDLDRRLDRIMAAVPSGEPGGKPRKRILASRGLRRSARIVAACSLVSAFGGIGERLELLHSHSGQKVLRPPVLAAAERHASPRIRTFGVLIHGKHRLPPRCNVHFTPISPLSEG